MKMGAASTVTYVDNDQIVAFGHPFLKKGSINYFMHNAYIFTVVNNLSSSFKRALSVPKWAKSIRPRRRHRRPVALSGTGHSCRHFKARDTGLTTYMTKASRSSKTMN